jgi:hypothetical protein
VHGRNSGWDAPFTSTSTTGSRFTASPSRCALRLARSRLLDLGLTHPWHGGRARTRGGPGTARTSATRRLPPRRGEAGSRPRGLLAASRDRPGRPPLRRGGREGETPVLVWSTRPERTGGGLRIPAGNRGIQTIRWGPVATPARSIPSPATGSWLSFRYLCVGVIGRIESRSEPPGSDLVRCPPISTHQRHRWASCSTTRVSSRMNRVRSVVDSGASSRS